MDLTTEGLEQLWTDLGKEDATAGQAALWTIVAQPKQAIPFVKDRLRPAADADRKRIAQLVVDLDSDQFAVREAASKELEQQEQQADTVFQKLLPGKPSAEVRKRLEATFARPRRARSPDSVRRLRTIQALETIGSAEARDLLDILAGGSAAAWETQEAKVALERLVKQPRR